ncbi:UNVERIFIED_CONTAM: hypothetical protein Sradi_1893000 [Sesamum radiatum]|uniref:Uncharacterized protein n=1 Tax=Sesamum radiatum TaxID=300843 RepID=A0AAW2U1R2_SESRA
MLANGGCIWWTENLMLYWRNLRSNPADSQETLATKIWQFIGFYGNPEVAKCKVFCDLLRYLHTVSTRSWLCMGDSNEILHQYKKKGVHPQVQW